jgi:CubicO group peptidase (beta-lactamase class C family)
MTIMQKLLLLFLFYSWSFPSFCQKATLTQTNDYTYPDSAWRYINDVAKEGWSVDSLNNLKRFIIDSTYGTGAIVIQSGKILCEYGDTKETSYLASCRKSVLSMLYGPYVKSGKINLSTTIEQLGLDDLGGLLPIEKRATIKDLLTARSGVYHPASNPGDATSMAPARGSVQPGSFWLYNNWDFNIAGHILEQETGKTIYELIDSILAKPVQMQDWNIKEQRKTGDTTRSKYLAYHMWFSTRDMARIGYLMLRNGKWNEQQIIPADWVKTTTSVVTTNKEAIEEKTAYFHFGYGYLWWIWDAPYNNGAYEGAYSATGAYGQFITVLPKLDLVVAFKTKYEYGRQTPTDRYLRVLDKLIAAKKGR